MTHSTPCRLPACRLGYGGLVLILLGLSVAGCVRLLEPREADVSYHILDGPIQNDSVSNSEGAQVGLRKPKMASYLDPARLVTRHGPSEVDFSDSHRWAGELDEEISRGVARHLETKTGFRSVETVPWAQGASFDYVVQLNVHRFEGAGPGVQALDQNDSAVSEGQSQVVVEWIILGPDGETQRARGTTRHVTDGWTVTDYSALVSRLEQSLDVVARDIAERLRSLDDN